MAIVIVSCIHCHHALVFLVRIRYVYNSFCFDRIHFDPIRFVSLGFHTLEVMTLKFKTSLIAISYLSIGNAVFKVRVIQLDVAVLNHCQTPAIDTS